MEKDIKEHFLKASIVIFGFLCSIIYFVFGTIPFSISLFVFMLYSSEIIYYNQIKEFEEKKSKGKFDWSFNKTISLISGVVLTAVFVGITALYKLVWEDYKGYIVAGIVILMFIFTWYPLNKKLAIMELGEKRIK